jgi:Recombination endonuclease VII
VAADLIGQTDMSNATRHSAETAVLPSPLSETRTCRTCGVTKELTEFRPGVRKGKTYYRWDCRGCCNTKGRDWYRDRASPEIPAVLPLDEFGVQICNKCHRELPLSQFSPNRSMRLGVRRECKKCCSEQAMAWLDKNYEKAWDTRLRRNFGITLDQYRAILAGQGGVCAICGEPPSIIGYRPSRRQGRPCRPMLVVDHDHETGKVRGLLCIPCNRGIGFLKDDAATVRAALKYLEERS